MASGTSSSSDTADDAALSSIRVTRALVAAAIVAAATVAGTPPASARACGIAIRADITYEEALVACDGRYESATVKLDLAHAGPGAAVLFPLPRRPRLDQPPGPHALRIPGGGHPAAEH